VNYAFRVFGRPPRTTACDCERSMEPGLPQKLFTLADASLVGKLRAPDNRLRQLLADHKDDGSALEELCLAVLSRRPTADERAWFDKYKARRANANTPPGRRELFTDVLWALVNTSEFIFNH